MAIARKTLISLSDTPYYHCVSRCVRKAFLCGDAYEHRREWVESRLLKLAKIYCIDIAAYAVMSNHYHVVLYVDVAEQKSLSFDEVIGRWYKLCKGNVLADRYRRGESMTKAEYDKLLECVEEWRERLGSISWFMRMMNEFIAREANKEDKCTGRFWEGRFKCQALLDEKALAACMAYVDLNPVRAKMAKVPERSAYTSVKKRAAKARTVDKPNYVKHQVKGLLPLVGNPRLDMPKGLPFHLTDYLNLVDVTGRAIRSDKRGYIDASESPMLQRLGLTEEQWFTLCKGFENNTSRFAGSVERIKTITAHFHIKRIHQRQHNQFLFG